jgi:hypothetical protein
MSPIVVSKVALMSEPQRIRHESGNLFSYFRRHFRQKALFQRQLMLCACNVRCARELEVGNLLALHENATVLRFTIASDRWC